jgi:hypothetical protein
MLKVQINAARVVSVTFATRAFVTFATRASVTFATHAFSGVDNMKSFTLRNVTMMRAASKSEQHCAFFCTSALAPNYGPSEVDVKNYNGYVVNSA